MKRDWNNTYESHELAGITIDGSINTLPQLNEEIVEDYRQAMREYGVDAWQDEWLEFPKITADGHLWSGFHTIAAALGEFGDKHVVAFEVEGKSRDDALLLATKENAKRGRKRSNEEKRVAVLRWLKHPKGKVWANSHIATQCNVSDEFVRKVVKNLTSNVGSEDYDAKYKRPSKLKYINKYGKQAVMETKSIGNSEDCDVQMDADTRQRYLDDFVEKVLQQAHIAWGYLTTVKDDEIEKVIIPQAAVHQIVSELGICEKYNLSELDVKAFVESGHAAAVVSVRKMRADLFNKSEAMWQKALAADFYKFENYTELIEHLSYYRNNADERDIVFAVLSQTRMEDPDKLMAGFPVARFRHWIDMINYWSRNLVSLFEPNEQGCEWFLGRKLYEDGTLREVDVLDVASEYNLTADKVRALIIQVEMEARSELIEIIHNRFASITEDVEYIAKEIEKLKASGDTGTLEAAADKVREHAGVVKKVAHLIQSVE